MNKVNEDWRVADIKENMAVCTVFANVTAAIAIGFLTAYANKGFLACFGQLEIEGTYAPILKQQLIGLIIASYCLIAFFYQPLKSRLLPHATLSAEIIGFIAVIALPPILSAYTIYTYYSTINFPSSIPFIVLAFTLFFLRTRASLKKDLDYVEEELAQYRQRQK